MNVLLEKNLLVRMRDGVCLATDVYRPAEPGPRPVLLTRLPYGKESLRLLLNQGDIFRMVQAGYAVVVQDVRGCFASEGDFSPLVHEEADGADTLAWALNQPWSSDMFGMFGKSYFGATQWLAARVASEGLCAIAPNICQNGSYQTYYWGGAFQLGTLLNWSFVVGIPAMQRLVKAGKAAPEEMGTLLQARDSWEAQNWRLPLIDQVPALHQASPFYFDWLAHPADDAYWQHFPQASYEQTVVPALNMGGWFDIFLRATLANYRGMKQHGGSVVARKHTRLVIGPWSHEYFTGLFPEFSYGLQASADVLDLTGLQVRWFDHWLKGLSNGVEQEKAVRLFVMGRNRWREEEDWPLPDTDFRPFYLHSQGHANRLTGDGWLSTSLPEEEPENVYVYDPHDPVPTVGGATLLPNSVAIANVGPRDQSLVETRADVLSYTTPPLEKPVEIIGPIELVLFVASSALDTDFTGKLVDVFPDGRAELLTDGILRARYRGSFMTAELLEPGWVYELRLDLGATANVFLARHRIRLEVSSSNFPRFDRNPNTGGVIAENEEACLIAATNRVFHDQRYPSHLLLPIIER